MISSSSDNTSELLVSFLALSDIEKEQFLEKVYRLLPHIYNFVPLTLHEKLVFTRGEKFNK